MKPQEVKPKGRRLIGKLSLRAAHNVHKVDVCACNLRFFLLLSFVPSND